MACRYYDAVLRALYPLFGDSESDNAVRDNAAGAVARMIIIQPQAISLTQVFIPVFII
jgi:importin-4